MIIVINNAGIQYVSPIDQFPIDKWNDIIAINLTAPFITTRTALPHFRRGIIQHQHYHIQHSVGNNTDANP